MIGVKRLRVWKRGVSRKKKIVYGEWPGRGGKVVEDKNGRGVCWQGMFLASELAEKGTAEPVTLEQANQVKYSAEPEVEKLVTGPSNQLNVAGEELD
ncbi:hypothetical protein COLO4_05297 [Corchorus olitorius]|uniref:Uncharacterized protein n=1 Tax=Corchorus olitorius TaxID=93759 RepID=A0A1R3KRG0_9ROSI|nr:hypothetical protein COLO4_05297 [Corchorus olitorius]